MGMRSLPAESVFWLIMINTPVLGVRICMRRMLRMMMRMRRLMRMIDEYEETAENNDEYEENDENDDEYEENEVWSARLSASC